MDGDGAGGETANGLSVGHGDGKRGNGNGETGHLDGDGMGRTAKRPKVLRRTAKRIPPIESQSRFRQGGRLRITGGSPDTTGIS